MASSMGMVKNIRKDNATKQSRSIVQLDSYNIIEMISNKGSHLVCYRIGFSVYMVYNDFCAVLLYKDVGVAIVEPLGSR